MSDSGPVNGSAPANGSAPVSGSSISPVLIWARLGDPVAQPLVAGLTADYASRYDDPGTEMASAAASEFDPPAGAFVLALVDGQTVAGGGLRRLSDGRAELKRMWTDPGWRRQGLASLVLRTLEERARALGYRELWLVTGPGQPEAVAMYEGAGWRPIANFGLYADEPRALSYAKTLAGLGT